MEKISDRMELIIMASKEMEVYNSGSENPIHNFIEIAHEFDESGDKEVANYYYELNKFLNDAKHYNGVYFNNHTNKYN